jgi:putative endonuclease
VAWFVYLARCADDTLYCGIARDVAERIAAHDAGKGARYTRGRGPLRVVATRRCRDKGGALRIEHAVKQLSRRAKTELAADPDRLRAIGAAVLAAARRRRATATDGSRATGMRSSVRRI